MVEKKGTAKTKNADHDDMAVKPSTAELNTKDRLLRISVSQFQMKPIKIWDDLLDHAESFIESAVKKQSHLLLLPETFTAQLFSTMPYGWTDKEMIQALSDMTDAYLDSFSEFSKSSNLFIIAGSHPVRRSDGFIYNVAHIFSPSGNVYTQDKLHITPKETRLWDLKPGNQICLFDSKFGRFGIQICYDIEFPEVSRLMALSGAEVIFVPFSTEDYRGYQRVRISAQARAIENYIYTAISGNCGSIPVDSYELNYAQSAVFSPSDQIFPTESLMIESDPEMDNEIYAELDLLHLAKRRKSASVRPLIDRREDVYHVQSIAPIEIIKIE